MYWKKKEVKMNRRNLIKGVGLGVATGIFGIASKADETIASTYAKATKGLPRLKITNVKSILTVPCR
jgi:predicted small secreted protein